MRTQTGFSLIEVLVSIVILSLALLGTAGLTAASLRNTSNAFYRSQATVLADDYFDRMRANRQAAINKRYEVDKGLSCIENNAATLAYIDCTEWTEEIRNALPDGDAEVRLLDNDVVRITIEWNNAENEFTTETRL
jgi:type IV pilus assembly protein PilV